MSGEQPDPDAIYEAVTSFTTWLVKDARGNPTTVTRGWRAFGSDPVVIAHFNDEADPKFRLAPVDSNRRPSREPAPSRAPWNRTQRRCHHRVAGAAGRGAAGYTPRARPSGRSTSA